MTLANMRENGVRAVTATCETCNRSADVNVDALPETVYVPASAAAYVQRVRRKSDIDAARLAHGAAAGLSPAPCTAMTRRHDCRVDTQATAISTAFRKEARNAVRQLHRQRRDSDSFGGGPAIRQGQV
jgi:hypothetical protein